VDFEFTEEQKKLRQEIREFCLTEPEGELEDSRITHYYSPELFRKLVNRGWVGLSFPKEYGGQGLTAVEEVILLEELAYARKRVYITGIGSSVQFFGTLFLRFGSEELKKTYLPQIARGESWFSQSYTEPEAGSDLLAIQTRAVREGDYYILNGQKMFSSSGHRRDHFPRQYLVVMAVTDPDAPREKGLSLFVVDTTTPGMSTDTLVTIAGWITNQLYIDSVRVPKENLVGEENRGWDYFMASRHKYWDRMNGNYQGTLLRALDDLTQYLKENPSLNTPLARQRIADMATRIEILRLLTYRMAWAEAEGLDVQNMASIARIFRDQALIDYPNVSMDILGLSGQLRATSKYAPMGGMAEYLYRNNVYYFFAGAGNLLMKNYIASRGLGLPGGLAM
jgi:hypothetical protein